MIVDFDDPFLFVLLVMFVMSGSLMLTTRFGHAIGVRACRLCRFHQMETSWAPSLQFGAFLWLPSGCGASYNSPVPAAASSASFKIPSNPGMVLTFAPRAVLLLSSNCLLREWHASQDQWTPHLSPLTLVQTPYFLRETCTLGGPGKSEQWRDEGKPYM